MPVFGITNALVPIVGYNYGAENKERIIKAIKIRNITGSFGYGMRNIIILVSSEIFVGYV